MLHWTKGGEGVTNFSKEDRRLYELAIAEYGDSAIYISDEGVYPCGGPCLADAKPCRDLSAFWRVFDTIKLREKDKLAQLLAAAKTALQEMCNTVAPRNSFTDAVDALDAAISKAEEVPHG